ncbi:MAG: hypothetical protein B7X04_02660 [Parcubacteria group bacterium 21-54-25]|nr:MAG: hypothetical protein B7X04_02660 [Parcubacteria group bacterium 21-54-25]HQU07746.1 MAP7 domain-containing protein [Candidatus Paceibacterota bacterium]
MRRTLTIGFFSLALLGVGTGIALVAGPVSSVHAKILKGAGNSSTASSLSSATNVNLGTGAVNTQGFNGTGPTISKGNAATSTGQPASQQTPPGANNPTTKSTGPGDVLGPILNYILEMFAWFVGATGVLMGGAIYYTVTNAGNSINSLGPIQTAWEVFRDLGNIILVFGFIAIGIATILDNASYGAKKALPKLLIVALMLNFSLFAAEFIVDTGNMFATQFYTQINGGPLPTTNASFLSQVSNEPISNILMDRLQLTTIYNINNPGSGAASAATKNPQQHWFITFMLGIVLFIVTAFVLGTIALMLITRFVILVFLLIVSPFGFIGLAGIPLISTYSKKWWSELTDQVLLAPVLMLLLLVALKLVQSATFLQGASATYASATSGNNLQAITTLLVGFTIIIGLMIAALIIAKSLSGKAAAFATKTQGRMIFGGLGIAGRTSLGLGFHYASEKFGGRLARVPVLGRSIASGLKRGASASYDVRGSKFVGAGLKNIGIDAGRAGGKGGYKKHFEDRVKGREEYADSLKKLSLEERQKLAAAKGVAQAAETKLKDVRPTQAEDEAFMRNEHTKALEEHGVRIDAARTNVTGMKAAHAKALEEHDARISAARTITENLRAVRSDPTQALVGEAGRIQEENAQKAEEALGREEALRNEKERVQKEDLRQAEAGLQQEEDARREKEREQKKEMEELRSAHAAERTLRENELQTAKAASSTITATANARATKYAENINWGPGRLFKANRLARQNIGDTINKSSTQAQVDALMKTIKDNQKKEDAEEA